MFVEVREKPRNKCSFRNTCKIIEFYAIQLTHVETVVLVSTL